MKYLEVEELQASTYYKCQTYDGDVFILKHKKNGYFTKSRYFDSESPNVYEDIRYVFPIDMHSRKSEISNAS